MVVSSTLFLIGIAALLIGLFEWTNLATLQSFPILDRLWTIFFQAVTLRTAGFNTVGYSQMRGGTLIFTMLLMFIGGSPRSTAGGVKTVTFFVLIGSAWSISRGCQELIIFKQRIAVEFVLRAGVIALFGMMISGAALMILPISEPELDIFALSFEVISAISTAELSLGITTELSTLGKLIMIILMYVGRLGSLTFAAAIIEKEPERRMAYPVEDILVG